MVAMMAYPQAPLQHPGVQADGPSPKTTTAQPTSPANLVRVVVSPGVPVAAVGPAGYSCHTQQASRPAATASATSASFAGPRVAVMQPCQFPSLVRLDCPRCSKTEVRTTSPICCRRETVAPQDEGPDTSFTRKIRLLQNDSVYEGLDNLRQEGLQKTKDNTLYVDPAHTEAKCYVDMKGSVIPLEEVAATPGQWEDHATADPPNEGSQRQLVPNPNPIPRDTSVKDVAAEGRESLPAAAATAASAKAASPKPLSRSQGPVSTAAAGPGQVSTPTTGPAPVSTPSKGKRPVMVPAQ